MQNRLPYRKFGSEHELPQPEAVRPKLCRLKASFNCRRVGARIYGASAGPCADCRDLARSSKYTNCHPMCNMFASFPTLQGSKVAYQHVEETLPGLSPSPTKKQIPSKNSVWKAAESIHKDGGQWHALQGHHEIVLVLVVVLPNNYSKNTLIVQIECLAHEIFVAGDGSNPRLLCVEVDTET